MDTKGDVQEIVNAYANARMFREGNQVKILLTIEISTLKSGRGGKLAEIAIRLLELFGQDFNYLLNSIMILVTKVNPEDYSHEDIREILTEITNSNENMPLECKGILNTILERNNILIIPFPKYVDNDKINVIKQKLDSIPTTTLSKNANISLDYKAKLMLSDLGRKNLDEMKMMCKAIHRHLEDKYTNVEYKQIQALEFQIHPLKAALNILTNELNYDNF